MSEANVSQSESRDVRTDEDIDLFNPGLLVRLPNQRRENGLLVRPLRSTDYDNGFVQLLGQLTEVGNVSKDQYLNCFMKMKHAGGYYIVVVEDLDSGAVIGSASLVVEQKFIHNCALRGRLEDVVVNSAYRGKQLGKLLVTTISQLAKRLHCYKLSLDCRDRLIPFYEGLGFVREPGNANNIENLTHKTGNYKQFDVFVTMLQSGLLKTSDCVSLDLLTFEDLEMLRARRTALGATSAATSRGGNRRYLILTYTGEFDRIHYPLPLEYCGLPDPSVLQATIRRLTAENERLRTIGVNKHLQKCVDQLTIANRQLVEENQRLMCGDKGARRLLGTIKTLENNVEKERMSFRAQIQKLRLENASLTLRVRQLTKMASRKPGDGSPAARRRSTPPPKSSQSRRSLARNSRSRSPSLSGRCKSSSLTAGSSAESVRSRDSSRPRVTRSYHFGAKEIDFSNVESRIQALQKMLKEGINLS